MLFHRACAWLLVVSFVSSTCYAETAATVASKQGWSKTKPASGPCVETPQGFMVPYTMKIPGTDISFDMVPIPGGKFKIGSPDSEAGRTGDEGPQFEVEIEPFWMAKHEVTWSEYKVFMDLYDRLKEIQALRIMLEGSEKPEDDSPGEKDRVKRRAELVAYLKTNDALRKRVEAELNEADAITTPTHLYEPEITYQYGDDPRQPAVTMTQFAAKHYTKWLTKTTGQFFRLPTEAEWEYACRAGSTTAYSFGDDPSQLGDYAWYDENSDGELHEVGTKKPNAWGLHDMHGSVAEWVLDELVEDGRAGNAGKSLKSVDAVVWPKNVYPRVIKGGHWDSTAEECRCAARLGSGAEDEWKASDPNLPLSPWWFTDEPAHGVGFRLIRPVNMASDEDLKKYWEADVDDIRYDVLDRLEGGRGVLEGVDIELPAALEQLKKMKGE